MYKMITGSIVLCSLFVLASCSTSPDAKTSAIDESQKENAIEKVSVESAETATKPLTTTADVVFDSVLGINFMMNDLMKKINSAIPSPVDEDDDKDE